MSDSSSSGGIGILGATFIVFLVLKLTGHITLSWFWVTSPLWIPAAIVLFVIVCYMLYTWRKDVKYGKIVKEKGSIVVSDILQEHRRTRR